VKGAPFFLTFVKNKRPMTQTTRISYLLITILLISSSLLAQKGKVSQFKIVFYNTENLFDTIDDPKVSDEGFLPTSKIAWTSARYNTKLQHTAKAIYSIDSVNLPAVVGLAEVENIGVLNDLVSKTKLRNGNYQAILIEGSDPRGIDVGLIFRKNVMKFIGQKSMPSARSFQTRAILYVKLADAKKDTFHLIVNHWKSRTGGASETESMRVENATLVKQLTDSILSKNQKANVILMGDFNDEPGNKSISEVLGAAKPTENPSPNGLYDLMWEPYEQQLGTLYYKDWDVFDQFMVSGNMLLKQSGKSAFVVYPYAYIFKPDFLLYKNKSGTMVPNRTAGSTEYFGGYSDHLPVYMVVNF